MSSEFTVSKIPYYSSSHSDQLNISYFASIEDYTVFTIDNANLNPSLREIVQKIRILFGTGDYIFEPFNHFRPLPGTSPFDCIIELPQQYTISNMTVTVGLSRPWILTNAKTLTFIPAFRKNYYGFNLFLASFEKTDQLNPEEKISNIELPFFNYDSSAHLTLIIGDLSNRHQFVVVHAFSSPIPPELIKNTLCPFIIADQEGNPMPPNNTIECRKRGHPREKVQQPNKKGSGNKEHITRNRGRLKNETPIEQNGEQSANMAVDSSMPSALTPMSSSTACSYLPHEENYPPPENEGFYQETLKMFIDPDDDQSKTTGLLEDFF